MFTLGLIVNPFAGLGGPTALKGSDGVTAEALARGGRARASERAARTLALLAPRAQAFELLTWAGPMGADAASEAGLTCRILGAPQSDPSTAEDTRRAAAALAEASCDLVLFTGGDGTARDMVAALADRGVPVLGIPAGVKMHSGVFAVTPEAAGRIVTGLLDGDLVGVGAREVRDIDEAGYRENVVRTRHYGELSVPSEPRWVQQTKIGGRESEALVLEELGGWIGEAMAADPGAIWVFGPGGTTAGIMEHLGLAPTLLGVDVVVDGRIVLADADAQALLAYCDPARTHIVVTVIGGQGHVLGRGNQQLAPELIRAIAPDRLHIVASRSKLKQLEGRPLQIDSGDAALDEALSGHLVVTTGYDDAVLYPAGEAAGEADGAD